jgi:hypothetical protein
VVELVFRFEFRDRPAATAAVSLFRFDALVKSQESEITYVTSRTYPTETKLDITSERR